MAEERNNPIQTKKCQACKSDINSDATRCPHCQADLRGFVNKHPVFSGCFILLVLFVLVPLFSLGSGKSEKSEEKTSTNTTATVAKEPESSPASVIPPKPEDYLKINTASFINEFDKNQLAAEEKYKGKLVEFVGYIGNISGGLLGNDSYLSINPTSEKYYFGTHITCDFDDKASLLSLENGQKVVLRGMVRGQSLGVIGITQCSVVEE